MSCESMKFRALLFIFLGLNTLSVPVDANDRSCDDGDNASNNNNSGRSGDCSNSCSRSGSRDCSSRSGSCSRDCSVSRSCSDSCSRSSSGSCSVSCSNSFDNCNDCDVRTTFVPRQVNFDPTYELGLNNYWHYYNNAACRPFVYLHAVPFFQKSRKGARFARCFFPGNDNKLTVREDGTGDIDSLWLGLVTARGQAPFRSSISICPERKTFGAVLYAYFDLCCFMDGLWASANFTPMRAEHRLNFRENLQSPRGVVPGRGTVSDVLTSNRFLRFGKFFKGKLSKTGVDDIQVKFGWNCWDTDCGHAGAYWVWGLPTGRRFNARHIFEPQVGSKHFSVGFGVNFDYMLWQWCNSNLNFMFDFKYRFAFRHDELRSFDFCCNGELSRFLPLVTFADRCPGDRAAAINFFTRCVSVEPRSTIDFWTALHYEWCGWNLELGYTLWWRDSERICFRNRCNNRKDLGIFDLRGVCPQPEVTKDAVLTTASRATIGQSFNNAKSDAVFTNVDDCDLNPCSAAAPRVLTNKVYGAASYNGLWCDTPWMVGVLGGYEFARHRACALDQWSVAVNLSVGF
jgi:hypothetical protein